MVQEIKCRRCEYVYEAEHKFGTPLPSCPKCGGKNYPHLPVHYKGKGFYSTDWMRSRVEANTKVIDKDGNDSHV